MKLRKSHYIAESKLARTPEVGLAASTLELVSESEYKIFGDRIATGLVCARIQDPWSCEEWRARAWALDRTCAGSRSIQHKLTIRRCHRRTKTWTSSLIWTLRCNTFYTVQSQILYTLNSAYETVSSKRRSMFLKDESMKSTYTYIHKSELQIQMSVRDSMINKNVYVKYY